MFCRTKGLIHRDIKPGNIFVDALGHFKLGDFGVARTAEKTMSSLSIQGTEKYMAPEVYFGRPYGENIDVYSLGMVLYQLMNRGRMPFLPLPPAQILYQDRINATTKRMHGEQMSPPCEANEKFAQIILKACRFDPKERYHTAGEMLKDLKGICDEKPAPPIVVREEAARSKAEEFVVPEKEDETLHASFKKKNSFESIENRSAKESEKSDTIDMKNETGVTTDINVSNRDNAQKTGIRRIAFPVMLQVLLCLILVCQNDIWPFWDMGDSYNEGIFFGGIYFCLLSFGVILLSALTALGMKKLFGEYNEIISTSKAGIAVLISCIMAAGIYTVFCFVAVPYDFISSFMVYPEYGALDLFLTYMKCMGLSFIPMAGIAVLTTVLWNLNNVTGIFFLLFFRCL